MMKRSLVVAICVFVGMCFSISLVFHSEANAAELFKMKISSTNWVGYGSIWLAKALGYYEEEGLDVELVRIEEKHAQFASLASNRIQGLCVAGATWLAYWKPEYPIKLVAGVGGGHGGGDGILVGPEIRGWQDFKGKKIACAFYTSMHMVVYSLLGDNGLDPKKDVEWADMPAGDAASAWAAKKVPIALTWEPHLTKVVAARPDGRIFLDSNSPDCPPLSSDWFGFNADFVRDNRKEAKACVRAIMRAAEYAEKNPRDACEKMAGIMGGWLKDPDLFHQLWLKSNPKNLEYCYISMTRGAKATEYKRRGFRQPAESVFDILVFFGNALMDHGKLTEFPPLELMVDSSIVRELYAEGL